MNFHELSLLNINFNFINGIWVTYSDFPNDIDIYGSHQRNPDRWTKINFQQLKTGNSTYLKFNSPRNFMHFRILYSGIINEKNNHPIISLDITQPLSPDEIKYHLGNSKITFVGCARNCISKIDESINVLLSLGKAFSDYKIIIFENDSNDGTQNRLAELAKENIIELIQFRNLDISFPLRTQRLSFARNQLLSKAISIDNEYYCVADLDGVIGNEFDTSSFFSNFKYLNCWDAVLPVNKGIYYDVWAFRHPSLWPWDYEREMNAASPILEDSNLLDFYVSRFQNINFRNLKGWLNVDSAFGGMGLYKLKKFKYSNYFGLSNQNQLCEHTIFHEKSKTFDAQIYINPEFIVNGISK